MDGILDSTATQATWKCTELGNLYNMISATRRWLRRNRSSFAIGFGVLGVGYVATQYVLSKIREAGERMSDDRIAKDK